jgi:hypothetical protein
VSLIESGVFVSGARHGDASVAGASARSPPRRARQKRVLLSHVYVEGERTRGALSSIVDFTLDGPRLQLRMTGAFSLFQAKGTI